MTDVYDFSSRHIWTGPYGTERKLGKFIVSVGHETAEYHYRVRQGELAEFKRWLRFVFQKDNYETIISGATPYYHITYQAGNSPSVNLQPISTDDPGSKSVIDLTPFIHSKNGAYILRRVDGQTTGPFPYMNEAKAWLRMWIREELGRQFIRRQA